MNATEWERIKSLFDGALKIHREDRLPWLQETCADSPQLCQTVLELLANYQESSRPDPRNIEPPPMFESGQVVAGRFRIVRLLARGGMGEVYEACDRQLH